MARSSKPRRISQARGTGSRQFSECHDKHGRLVPSDPEGPPQPSLELQQKVLNVFEHALSPEMNDELSRLLQEVKRNLFNRDFSKAFGGASLLETYAFRWSPTRALAYMEIFRNILPLAVRLAPSCWSEITGMKKTLTMTKLDNAAVPLPDAKPEAGPEQERQPHQSPLYDPSEGFRIVCVGGGSGAELVALAGYLHWIGSAYRDSRDHEPKNTSDFDMTIVDIADWSNIVRLLHEGVTTSPRISDYASPARKASNAPLVDASNLQIHFRHCDILYQPLDQLKSIFNKDVRLVTLMFTLNELYTASIKATTNFLLALTTILSPGAILLVVDSPGSYSTIDIGSKGAPVEVDKNNDDNNHTHRDDINNDNYPPSDPQQRKQKRYPMHWLLNHTLLDSAGITTYTDPSPFSDNAPRRAYAPNSQTQITSQWERILANESVWFRRSGELKYPIELEDMRYQIHVYRRI